MKKIRISAVSYANTYPFLLGLEHHLAGDDFEISRDVPSECARKLINNEADIGLIPIATIPLVPNASLIGDFCIGAKGKVKTVLLLSKVPLDQIKKVYLDQESRSSVNLAKVLAQKYWHQQWEYEMLPIDFLNQEAVESLVLIGDKTQLEMPYPYRYDLAEVWMEFTGKPFVFAAWVTNKPLPDDFINRFNAALNYGINHKEDSIAIYNNEHSYDLLEYLESYISYSLDTDKEEAMNLFLRYLQDL